MNQTKQTLSALLAIIMTLALLPTAAFAANNDKAIQLGASNISGYDSTNGYDYIYYGEWDNSPIKWRVLDEQTNTQNEGLFLLSDVLLGTGTYGGVYFDNSGSDSNVWQNSTAQTWCKNFYSNNFSSKEQNAVLATTKSDSAYTSTSFGYAYGVSSLSGDKVFFLSAEEAENSAYGFTDDNARIANYGNSAGYWWLRSPYANTTSYAGLVYRRGGVHNVNVNLAWAARPAFNLDLNSVLFISAAEGGKAGDAIFEIADYDGNEWKLTLLDDSREFGVTEETAGGKPGDTITLNYTGAATGTNEYISVIIADNSGARYYGRVAQPDSASGQISMKIPASLAEGTYTLNVFSEQYNGGENDDTKLTDYASAFEAVTLTVFSDTTAPAITTESLPAGTVKQPYSATLEATGNHITWSLDSGTLPDGLTLNGDGTITGTPTAVGSSTFTVTATNNSGSANKVYTLTIKAVSVNSLELNKGTLTLQEKGSDTLTVTVKPADATNQDVTWESSNTGIATVSADGRVTAICAGTATITATAQDGSGVSASCSVTVTHGKMVHIPKKDATCTEDGTKEYWSCSVCNKNFSDAEGKNEITDLTIPANGHDLTRHDKVEPTCTGEGTKEHWSCSDCGKNFEDEDGNKEITDLVIEAEGHKATHIPAKAPTATEAGNIEYWYCSICGKTFKDEAMTEEITKADTVLPATGDTQSPATGDNSNLTLWLALAGTAFCGLLGTAVYGRKRRSVK